MTAEDLQVYAREVRTIEGVECSASQGLSRIQRIDAQLRRIDAGANPTIRDAAATVARELRAIEMELGGGSEAPNALNLRGKINWLRIQVGSYTGRPTPAQHDWIARFAADGDRLAHGLQTVVDGSLAQLNARLKTAGLSEVVADGPPPR